MFPQAVILMAAVVTEDRIYLDRILKEIICVLPEVWKSGGEYDAAGHMTSERRY